MENSIIIPTKDRLIDIIDCLKSIKKQSLFINEIIIVDSSINPLNQNDSFNKIFNERYFINTKLVYKRSNPGTSRQRNIGIGLATKDIIFFLDDDSIIESNYIEDITKMFLNPRIRFGLKSIIDDRDLVGIMCDYKQKNKISFKLLKKIIKLQAIIKKLFFLQHDYGSGKVSQSGFARHPYGTKKIKQVYALGGCCAYKKEILKRFKFDENLEKLGPYAYMEDFDLSYRIGQEYKLVFIPDKLITHKMSPNNRHNIRENRLIYIYNYSYLFFKNIYPKNKFKILFYYWSILGLFIEAIVLLEKDYIKGYAKGLYLFYFVK